jgi:hypothetical protein
MNIKNLSIATLFAILSGCGATEDSTLAHNSFAVATEAELPTCDETREGHLYYIKGDGSFRSCESSVWTALSIKGEKGDAGTAGLTAVSSKKIDSTGTDYCTELSGDACYFSGGQIVKFSDGSIFVSANFEGLYVASGDTDNDQNSFSALVPASSAIAWHTLSSFVARGSGYKSLFIVYVRSTDSLSIWYDSDGNSSLSAGDTQLTTLTTSD